ncbi:hypothetical protein PL8927_60038 [Planktothrix serta PCC 8927]|uniref:Uncharacterized protein n=1 Tax=Planktothrix serta PCC 8927 TaxID=671068 RepID=A0A7Z9DY42_9CYAN|nr:hypothetical protein PL8927_60038 [Planktothrix serta PCC 8927]
MSWENLENILSLLLTELNQQNSVQSPQEIWDSYQSQIQSLIGEHPQEFVTLLIH